MLSGSGYDVFHVRVFALGVTGNAGPGVYNFPSAFKPGPPGNQQLQVQVYGQHHVQSCRAHMVVLKSSKKFSANLTWSQSK